MTAPPGKTDPAFDAKTVISALSSEFLVSPPSWLSANFAANYWINRYTILDITRMLRDKSLTFVQISDMFNFSSPAYFSRYVQQNLGVKPSDYRE